MTTKKAKTIPFTAIVLAAGKGTRMKSALPKVMHEVAGRSMVQHVIATVSSLSPHAIITVIAPGMEQVKKAVSEIAPAAQFAIQKEQLGTGHAVKSALAGAKNIKGHLLVLYADTPLISVDTLRGLLTELESRKKPAVAVLGMYPFDPAEYGRLKLNAKGELDAIIEYKDATADERAIILCNSGVMALRGDVAAGLIGKITNKNAKKEYYLTDCVALARKAKHSCSVVECLDEDEVMGVNSRRELMQAEAVFQQRMREQAMADGVTLIDPYSTHFSYDTQLGADTIVHPNVFFGPGVSVGSDVLIRSFCHLEGVKVANSVIIGPFARLRPGTSLAEGVHIGNFVEVKNTLVEHSAKINHLSYIGDASVGKNANIGAGTITCNYDGFSKHKTEIGADVFIGSNTALVAPVKLGKGAMVGAGSVITQDVAADDLAVTRPLQVSKKGGAAEFRRKRARKKT